MLSGIAIFVIIIITIIITGSVRQRISPRARLLSGKRRVKLLNERKNFFLFFLSLRTHTYYNTVRYCPIAFSGTHIMD